MIIVTVYILAEDGECVKSGVIKEIREYNRVIILRLTNNKKMIFISLVLCDIIAEYIAKNWNR